MRAGRPSATDAAAWPAGASGDGVVPRSHSERARSRPRAVLSAGLCNTCDSSASGPRLTSARPECAGQLIPTVGDDREDAWDGFAAHTTAGPLMLGSCWGI